MPDVKKELRNMRLGHKRAKDDGRFSPEVILIVIYAVTFTVVIVKMVTG